MDHAQTLAGENLTLFLHCFNKGHDALQVYALHILCDILLTHGRSMIDNAAAENSKPLIKIFSKALKADDKPDVQSAGCTAICKLMLGKIFQDEDLLKALVIAYFNPTTAQNLGLRQALTYFLPVYCHSRRENQERMQKIAVEAIHSLIVVNENMDEEEDMVGLTTIAAQMVDWTDPRKLVVLDDYVRHEQDEEKQGAATDPSGMKRTKGTAGSAEVNGDVHLYLTRDILGKICSSACHRMYSLIPNPSIYHTH